MRKESPKEPLDEEVEIVEYDPHWADYFKNENEQLRRALGKDIEGIEHFGSTAVPGLSSKPIVDIMIGLRALKLNEKQLRNLSEMGYIGFGEASIPGRLYFRKRVPVAFNLAVTEYGSDLWRDNLLLRDYLRTHKEEAQHYAREKEQLMSQGIRMLLAYSEGKKAFLSEVMQRARKWMSKQ